MIYEIEKGFPIPPSKKAGGSKYRFADMEVGDSFFVRAAVEARKQNRSRLGSAAASYSKRNSGKTFTVRDVEEEDKDGTPRSGLRVWRTT